ncbi:mitochondrial inner membrane protein [Thelephora terrestris]|uniref:Succinate dehydrogenase [ubiquinone] cytochrome b small subunit n=1 Tax=Thelephora terrestris TaxID=56493 RepID=A0A9P6HQL5_9AGAM|nr:mitochondrial inner membrane protein [Thelephora terrestris]
MSTSLLLRSTLPRHIARQPTLVGAVWLRKALASTAAAQEEQGEFKYVPGGPIYKGTVNDPTTFPPPNKSEGSYHWAFERLLAASLLPLTGAAFVTSGSAYPVLDGLLGVSLVMHSHIGFDSALVDYVHKRKFPKLGPTLTWLLRATTVGVLVGVYQFNTQDIGLTELIAKAWHA